MLKCAKPLPKGKSNDKHKRGKRTGGKTTSQDRQVTFDESAKTKKKSGSKAKKKGDKSTTSKASKRKARKKRPGKNARKANK